MHSVRRAACGSALRLSCFPVFFHLGPIEILSFMLLSGVQAYNDGSKKTVHQFAVRQVDEECCNQQKVKCPAGCKPWLELVKRMYSRRRKKMTKIRIACNLRRYGRQTQSLKDKP